MLKLSNKELKKPRMNPKSFDSENEIKLFSKEQDHYLVGMGSIHKEGLGLDQEGSSEHEMQIMEATSDLATSHAYEAAAKSLTKLHSKQLKGDAQVLE